MREYVKFDVDAEAPLQATIPATRQEQSSESSKSSTEVPPFSRYCTPEERGQSIAGVERGDRHDGDRGRATFATSATQEAQSSESSESSRGAVPSESAEDAPAQYWSDVLQERFWVAPTATQAAALAAQGQVVYQPDEIWRLRDLQAPDPAAFPAKLRAIHQVKQAFGARIDALEQEGASTVPPVFQTPPGTCYACGSTQRWRSVYGTVVCARCHPPADAALVAAWEGEA